MTCQFVSVSKEAGWHKVTVMADEKGAGWAFKVDMLASWQYRIAGRNISWGLYDSVWPSCSLVKSAR